jgi:hypothetical protein
MRGVEQAVAHKVCSKIWGLRGSTFVNVGNGEPFPFVPANPPVYPPLPLDLTDVADINKWQVGALPTVNASLRVIILAVAASTSFPLSVCLGSGWCQPLFSYASGQLLSKNQSVSLRTCWKIIRCDIQHMLIFRRDHC